MKLNIVLIISLVGVCGQCFAEIMVVGKNHEKQRNQLALNNSTTMPKSKASNKDISKKCNELAMIARTAITARLNGERVHSNQAKVEELYHGSSSPVKNDKPFNILAHKVVLSAYSEKNLPKEGDLKGRNTLKNNFSHNQKMMCIEHYNRFS